MTDPAHAARLWADRSFLRDVQYKTDVNLAARQSIYAYQRSSSPTCGAWGKPPACPTPDAWSRP